MKFVIVFAALLLASPALAVDLSVDQTAQILRPDGKTPMTTCDAWSDATPPVCTHKSPATVGEVIQDVLVATLADPSGRGSDPGNAKAGNLAIRFYGQPVITPKIDEIQLILARVDRVMDPVTIARMHQILEPGKPDNPTNP